MTFSVILLFIKGNWRKIAIAVGIIILFLIIFFTYQSCKPQPKIDIETVNAINTVNEQKRKEELTKTFNENADVIKANDGRTALTDLTVDERNKQIAEKVKEADKKIAESKANGENVTQEGLECLLIPENCI